MLDKIRSCVSSMMSEKRFKHTLGVEREAVSLANIFIPEKVEKLRVAALLHDITKECSNEKQIMLCLKYSIAELDRMRKSPKLYHAVTGAYVARELFPEAVDDEVFDAIRYHTTGRRGMTLCEKLIYLADYIEDTRTFEDCVELRRFFYDGMNNSMTYNEKYKHLQKTLLLSFDMTINGLIRDGVCVDPCTNDAKAFIEEEIAEES